MNNHNPYIDEYLKIYSQSMISTGNTRGYDEETYIETLLDKKLIPKIFSSNTRLVILTGNAGDGKTAFIQKVEDLAREKSAIFSKNTDNGCVFSLNNINYETLYDGSQDFENKDNKDVLAEFFEALEGSKEPKSSFTKIIAINEGKLRDFILNKRKYEWLGRQIYHYFENAEYKLPESLVFINLNLRTVIDDHDTHSIVELLLNKFLDTEKEPNGVWEHCTQNNCAYSDRCYIKYNVDTFNNAEKGFEVRNRLKKILLAVHLKQDKHITMRDIRSVLSFILFNKYNCRQIQKDIDNGNEIIDRFYYNNIFNSEEKDRILQLLAKLDVAAVSNPKLDNFLFYISPSSNEFNDLLNRSPKSPKTDINHLQNYYDDRPQGTQDDDPDRKINAEKYYISIRRKILFEGNDEITLSKFSVGWMDLLPYHSRNFALFENFLRTGQDTNNELRNAITLAISKSERIYNDLIGSENLCIRSVNSTNSSTKAFYGFKAAGFKVEIPHIGQQEAYIEHFPSNLFFKYIEDSAELTISLDLFEILMRIKEGYMPTSSEIKTFFLNLEMFKRRVTTKNSDSVFLTEDDTNLFKLERTAENKLVMTRA